MAAPAAKRPRVEQPAKAEVSAVLQQLFCSGSADAAAAATDAQVQAAVLLIDSAYGRVAALLRASQCRDAERRRARRALEETWMQLAQRLPADPRELRQLPSLWADAAAVMQTASCGWSSDVQLADVAAIYADAAAAVRDELPELAARLQQPGGSQFSVVRSGELPEADRAELTAAAGALVWPDADPDLVPELRHDGASAAAEQWQQALVWRAAGAVRLIRPLTAAAVAASAKADGVADSGAGSIPQMRLALHSLLYRAMFCAGQAMGLPQPFHDAMAQQQWARGGVGLELYTHLLNKRHGRYWHSCSLFPAVDDAVGRMQDFNPSALVDALRQRGWGCLLACNPPYVEEVFDRDLPRVAAALREAAAAGVTLSCCCLLPSTDAERWSACAGIRAVTGSPFVRSRWLLPAGQHKVALQDGSREVVMAINQTLLLLSTDARVSLSPALWQHLSCDGTAVLPESSDLLPCARGDDEPPLLLLPTSPREPYQPRHGRPKLARWWQLRSQALAAAQFLSRHCGRCSRDLVLHYGAPSAVLRFLAAHFPHLTWQKVDGDAADVAGGALLLAFAADAGGGAGDGAAVDAQWRRRLAAQRALLKQHRPSAALLTVRPPFSGTTPSWSFPHGELFLPIWGHPTSTLCFVALGSAPQDSEWDLVRHEEQMHYFNSVVREQWHYNHGVRAPGLDRHYDGRAEVAVLSKLAEAAGKDVAGVSAELTAALGHSFTAQRRQTERDERAAAAERGMDDAGFKAFLQRRHRLQAEPVWHTDLTPAPT